MSQASADLPRAGRRREPQPQPKRQPREHGREPPQPPQDAPRELGQPHGPAPTAVPPDLVTPDVAVFRQAMGRFATGVSLVTTHARRADHGMTVNSLASVSLDPLLVLFCVEAEARFHDQVIDAGVWGVSLLSVRDEQVSRWFAMRGRPVTADFDRFPFRRGPVTGVPLLASALGTLECRTVAEHAAGDHTIVVGQVLSVEVPEDPEPPLLYYAGRYHEIGAATPGARRDAVRLATPRPPF